MMLFGRRKKQQEKIDRLTKQVEFLKESIKESREFRRNNIKGHVNTEKEAKQKLFDVLQQPKLKNKSGEQSQTKVTMDSRCTPNAVTTARQNVITYSQLDFFNSGFLGYSTLSVLSQDPYMANLCGIKGETAVETGYQITFTGNDIENPSDKISAMKTLDLSLDINELLEELDYFRNVHGVSYAMFKVKDADYTKPFNLDGIKKGSYEGFVRLDPQWVAPMPENDALTDPTSRRFYKPTYYQVEGLKIHYTWICQLDGMKVPTVLKPNYNYGGMSLIQHLWKRVLSAENCADEAPEILKTMRLMIKKTDIEQAILNENDVIEGEEFNKRQMTNFSTYFIGEDEEVTQLTTALQGIDDITMSQFQLFCAIAKVPITIAMSDTPKGFQSTGENELNQFYNECAKVTTKMKKVLNMHYRIMCKSLYGQDMPVSVQWNKFGQLTELEKATIQKTKSETALNYHNADITSQDEERSRLNDDEHSSYNLEDVNEKDKDDDEAIQQAIEAVQTEQGES